MHYEAFALLRKYETGFCIHDMPESRTLELVTLKLAYVRFHGHEGKYGGNYSDSQLEAWADRLLAGKQKRIRSYVYFNNNIGGFAPKNALSLLRLIAEKESQ